MLVVVFVAVNSLLHIYIYIYISNEIVTSRSVSESHDFTFAFISNEIVTCPGPRLEATWLLEIWTRRFPEEEIQRPTLPDGNGFGI